jgi:hypothetical protein
MEEEKIDKDNSSNNSNNLPILKEKQPLSVVLKRSIPRLHDGLINGAKVLGYTAGSLAFLSAYVFGAPLPVMLGFIACTTGGLNHALYRKVPSLMFVSSRAFGQTRITQNTSISDIMKLREYDSVEKGSLMALQTLIGFARMKDELQGTSYTMEDGQKVYTSKMYTITHGINIKNLKMLENLGYIKIDSIEEEFKSGLGAILPGQPKKKPTLLIMEKLGFGNFDDVRKIAKAFITRDTQTLESMTKQFEKVSFRLTDKPIDFEDLYAKFNNEKPYENNKERAAIRRFALLFDKNRGLFATKGIDIKNDRFNRPYIDYHPQESFAARQEKVFEMQRKNKEKEVEQLDRDVRSEARSTIERNTKTQSGDNIMKEEPVVSNIATVDDPEQIPEE